ncbi:MAG: peptide deformylase [Anaerolineales bacterium]|nr:peptide deformylase [Anaerolineales bacterium]MCW5856534.1 peptide deformylase [Anaerolineales bacterium]
MPLLPIVKYPNDILRRKAQDVTVFDDNLQQLIDDMFETMRNAPGVGLAAPQVNVPLRLTVIEYGEQEEDSDEPIKLQQYVLINPEITRFSPETEVAAEGCLSMPGLVGDVERSLSVTVKAQNRRGQPVKLKAEGWLARIFQHEIDHLNGVMYVDKADNLRSLDEDAETDAD